MRKKAGRETRMGGEGLRGSSKGYDLLFYMIFYTVIAVWLNYITNISFH